MAITSLSISNSALSKIGVPLVSSLTDNSSKQARLCNEQYGKLRDEVLRDLKPHFARKRVSLSPVLPAPAFGYKNAFSLPSDFIGIVEFDDPAVVYAVENGQILSDESTLNLIYIYQVVDTSKFTSDFAETLAFRMAADMAYSMTNSTTLAQGMYATYKDRLKGTRTTSAQEGTPDDPNAHVWELARF